MLERIWLKILGLSMHLLVGVCAFCLAVLLLHNGGFRYAHNLSPDVLGLSFLGAILTFSLIVARAGKTIYDAVRKRKEQQKAAIRTIERRNYAIKFLDTLSDQEHAVLSYLVQKNQQSFNAELTSKVVVTLRHKKLIEIGTGHMDIRNAAFMIPSFIWEELEARKDEFNSADLDGPHPWREHWMSR